MDIIQRLLDFLNYALAWFTENIAANIGAFIRAVGEFIIAVLYFFIDIIKWIVSKV